VQLRIAQIAKRIDADQLGAMNSLRVGTLGVSLFSEIVSCSAGHLYSR
jgi:hypothetical protein